MLMCQHTHIAAASAAQFCVSGTILDLYRCRAAAAWEHAKVVPFFTKHTLHSTNVYIYYIRSCTVSLTRHCYGPMVQWTYP